MEITTWLFALLVLLSGILYYFLPKRLKAPFLLAASVLFLLSWSWKFLVTLLLLSLINYALGFLLPKGRLGKAALWTGIGLDILALFVFKYSRYYLPGLLALLKRMGLPFGSTGIEILEPIGLSFIVVQLISYLVDVRLGRTSPERRPDKFALYVIYFPKLLAGPIERAKPFLAQLDSPQQPTQETILRDLGLVVVGLIRKLIIADSLFAMIPDGAFQQPSQFPAPMLAIWLLEYAFALYNDFAGYSSMVRGISGFFGIELTSNFNVPYFARSFSEFWTRWHISFSNWLRDYIFFPCSRALMKRIPDRENAVHLLVPPILTMLVSGVWHGLAWNTLLWGLLQGIFLALGQWSGRGKARQAPGARSRLLQVISAAGVFVCILLAWVPFHASLLPALRYWRHLAVFADWNFSINVASFIPAVLRPHYAVETFWNGYFYPLLQMVLILVPALGLDILQYKEELRFLKWPSWLLGALLALAAAAIFLLSFAEKGAPFVYQGF